MTKYDQVFGTDWEKLEIDAAVDRAYAIGVSEVFGEKNREELQAIYDEMDTTYDRSIVELAYEEGRSEARGIDNDLENDSRWSALLTDEWVQNNSSDVEESSSPELLNINSLLERSEIDSTEVVSRPEFLNK
jgi:hypothetical protein